MNQRQEKKYRGMVIVVEEGSRRHDETVDNKKLSSPDGDGSV
jgi:hypothetical protein